MNPLIDSQLSSQGVARVIVALKEDTSASDLRARLGDCFVSDPNSPERAIAASMKERKMRARPASQTQMRVFPNLNLMLGTVDARGLASLRADSEKVKNVSGAPDISLIRPTAKAEVDTPKKGVTWGISALDVEKLWAKDLTGAGVLVGHLDTGIDAKHPALKKALEEFAEFDELGFPISPAPDAWDSDDHGTHTAGTIAGRDVKGIKIGVAPGAKLLSGMVIEGGDAVARVLAGMDWIVGSGAKVLSMSLGFRGYWPDFISVMQILRDRGVLPVIAVGNEGAGKSRSPGNYSEALCIGAYGEDKTVPDFSGSQRFARPVDATVPDLVAPGVGIVSAMPKGGYQQMRGSSMATPHIAGLAALLWEAKPQATVDEVEAAILKSCKRPSAMQGARCGRGIPNALRAYKALME